MSEWPNIEVKEVCELIVDCVNKTAPLADQSTPYKMIRTTNIRNGRVDLTDCKYVEEDVYEKWTRRAKVLSGDVLLTREAPIGEVGYVTLDDTIFLGQRIMQYRANPQLLDSRYLLYAFLSPSLRHQFGAHEGSGSVVSHIRVGDCHTFKIPLPPLPEQRAIAYILGTLDDKIELNRQMNETLEAMARAIFKSWFVDFDPVRAKAEGRDTGLPEEIAELFPDSFEETEMGEVPRGWEVGTVDQEFNLTMGQSPPGETYNEIKEGIPFYQGKTDFGFRFPSQRMYCTAPTRFAEAGDTLISVRAPVGDINMASERCCIGRGIAAARHKSGSRSYTYYFMKSIEEVFARFEAEGTVFGSISKKDFHDIQCIIVPRDVINIYEMFAMSLDERISINSEESRTLAELRDTLLPKLISGELRIKDAGEIIGNVPVE